MNKFILWLVWVSLVAIYVRTVAALCAMGQYQYLGLAVVNLACGLFLWFAEGFEIAFAMIWPTRHSADADIRGSLQGLDAEFVLAQRQVIVVATITVVSLTSTFEWIVIPGVGKLQSYGAPAWFSGLFTTFTILWFCQVFPKRVAAKSAERFWRLSKWLLRPIVVAGKILDLPAPSDDLVALWDAIFGSGQRCSQHQPPLFQVAPLWAPCDCEVCNPRSGSTGFSNGSSLGDCRCAMCNPTAAQTG